MIEHDPYPPELVRAHVSAGAAWLDQACPGWHWHIDIGTLDMQAGDHCVLGQSANCIVEIVEHIDPWDITREFDYSTVLEFLADRHLIPHDSMDWSIEHGFYVRYPMFSGNHDRSFGELAERWRMLKIAWVEQIDERRAIEGVPPA